MVFTLVHAGGAKKRERDGVQKGEYDYKTFTAPFLPSLLRVSVGDGKTVVCFLDGNRFEKKSEGRDAAFVPSPSSLFPRAHGAGLARAILSLLVARESCFKDVLALCVCDGGRSRKKQRTGNAGIGNSPSSRPIGAVSVDSPMESFSDAQTSRLRRLWTEGIPPAAAPLREVAAPRSDLATENVRTERPQPAPQIPVNSEIEPQIPVSLQPQAEAAHAEPAQPAHHEISRANGKSSREDKWSASNTDTISDGNCEEEGLEKVCAYSGVRRPSSKVSAHGEFYCRPRPAENSSNEVAPPPVLTKCALHERNRVTHHMCNIDFRDDNILSGTICDEDWEEGKKFCSLDCASKFKNSF